MASRVRYRTICADLWKRRFGKRFRGDARPRMVLEDVSFDTGRSTARRYPARKAMGTDDPLGELCNLDNFYSYRPGTLPARCHSDPGC